LFSEETLAEIRERVPVVDFISEHVQLKKAGKNFKGLCPFHAEKTPSFMVSPERQTFHCFGCASGGNVFHFLMKLDNLSFPEAVLRLAERAGVPVEKGAAATPESRERRDRALEIQRAAAWYYRCLLQQTPKTEPVWAYFAKRGLDDSIVERFHLGYCPPSDSGLQAHLLKKGFSPEEIQKSSLYRGPKEFFRGRFLFPIFNHEKKVVALGGRLFNEKDLGPKYLNSPESEVFKKGELFYGLHLARDSIRQSGQAIVVEGYLDVITMHAHGFTQAIAPLGTGFTPHHGKALKRFSSQVILLFDADKAGQDATSRALEILLAQGIFPEIVALDPGEDPDSCLRRFGRLHFEKKLTQRRNLLENLIDKASASIPSGSQHLVQKGQTARNILALLEKIPDSIVRNLYKRRLAETLEIPEAWMTTRSPSLPAPPPAPKKRPLWLPEEETIFEIWMKCPDLRGEIIELVDLEDFCTEEAAGLARRFWQEQPSEASEMTGHYFDLAEPGALEVLSEITLRPSGLEETQTAKHSLFDAWYRLKWKKLQNELIRVKTSGAGEEMDLIHEKIQALSQWFKNKARLYGEGKAQ
jgi:DNA primase